MIHHVAVFRWRAGTAPEQIEAIERELAKLPGLIPELRRYAFGPDAGLREGNADFAVVAEVDDEDAWRRYSEHPAHQRVLSDWIGPVLEERSAVQLRRG